MKLTYKFILLQAALLLAGISGLAQTATQNYVRTRVPRRAVPTNAKLDSLTANRDSVMTTVQYIDGLGRPLQTVMQRAAPSGYDIIQPFEYDGYGREAVKYLPYRTTNTSYGSYRADALGATTGARNFYNPGGGSTDGKQTNGIVRTPVPFAQTGFEASPLGRVLEQGAPGLSWQVNGTPDAGSSNNTLRSYLTVNDQTTFTSSNVTTNAGSRKVALYTATINADGSRTLARASSNTATYPSNQLSVVITRDENWKPGSCFGTTESYKDKEGRLVLKRTYNVKGTVAEQLSTYYVYDDLGNLAFVLPPGVNPDATVALAQNTLDTKAYQYRYDDRGRLTRKKLPGRAWDFIVYNTLDQAVFTQDGNQRNKTPQQWSYMKYDALGRVIITGIWNYSGSTADGSDSAPSSTYFSTLQTVLNATTSPRWESRDNSSAITGYTNVAIPQDAPTTYNSIAFYDDYLVPGLPATYDQHTNVAYTPQTSGKPTVTKTLVLNTTGDYLWNLLYYDKEGKILRTFSQHYLGGTSSLSANNYDDVTTTYNFVQQPLTVVRKHYVLTAGLAQLRLTSTNTYTYDQMGRKRNSYSQLKDGSNATQAQIIVAQNNYNEIGQIIKKGLHSINGGTSFLQTLNYRYNARGWLTNINNPKLSSDGGLTSVSSNDQFGMDLKYDDATSATKQYNGNIATLKSNNKMGTDTLIYDYSYDKLNRLVSAISSGASPALTAKTNYYNENMSYDNMGNIQTMNRYENISGVRTNIDSLTYTLSGYRPTKVDDASLYTGAYGFKDTVLATEYLYDNNGNMTRDWNRRISSISYNILNLPQTITKKDGSTVVYIYDAAGMKLRKLFTPAGASTITTEYVNGVEYDNSATVSFIQTEEGRARNGGGGSYKYEYDLKDHLGNTRITVTWNPTDAATQLTPYNLQRQDYYAFGYTIQSLQGTIVAPKNEYLYNGKELQEETGLYDYGARLYDPLIGRWNAVDPLAELNKRWSPYAYTLNNPTRFIDPDGMATQLPDGTYRENGVGGDVFNRSDKQVALNKAAELAASSNAVNSTTIFSEDDDANSENTMSTTLSGKKLHTTTSTEVLSSVKVLVAEPSETKDVGHAGIQIDDNVYGFYPTGSGPLGNAAYSQGDLWAGNGRIEVDSRVVFDGKYTNQGFTEFTLNTTSKQSRELKKNLINIMKHPGSYSLLGNQCTSVAVGAMVKAGITINNPVPEAFTGRLSPINSALNIMSPAALGLILNSDVNKNLVTHIKKFP